MRIALLVALTLSLCGCYTRTHITRTVKRADGSTEIYENRSDGYNYNPNFTGHADNTVQFHNYGTANSKVEAVFPPQMEQFGQSVPTNGQYTIR